MPCKIEKFFYRPLWNFICQVSFHSVLYVSAMKFSKFVNGGIFLWKNVFFPYNGENDIHHFTEYDTWLYHTANVEIRILGDG